MTKIRNDKIGNSWFWIVLIFEPSSLMTILILSFRVLAAWFWESGYSYRALFSFLLIHVIIVQHHRKVIIQYLACMFEVVVLFVVVEEVVGAHDKDSYLNFFFMISLLFQFERSNEGWAMSKLKAILENN